MPRYEITPKAGPYVAGQRNPGAGQTLELSEHQAAHELRLGTLRLVPPRSPKAVPFPETAGSLSRKMRG